MFLADTLIRAYLHTDPTKMSDDEWGVQVELAEWVKNDLQSIWRIK